MTSFHENIRNVLSEIDKFLDSLKSEKLSKKIQTNKEKVIELIKKLREEWPALETSQGPAGLAVPSAGSDRDVSNESIPSKSSGSGNAEDDDTAYGDNVPDKSVKDLVNAVKAGFLEKKRKKAALRGTFQKRYCVIQDRTFYYYEKNTSSKQAGAFYLEGYEFREAPQIVKDASKKDLCFELVATGKRTYQFLVESKDEFQVWREAITGTGSSSGTAGDLPSIEGELEDIYEEMDEVAEKAKAMATSEASNNLESEQEVYDDAETMREDPEEIYDDVDNVDKSNAMPVKPEDNIPPPVPPPMSKTPVKPSMPLPEVPSRDIQHQPLPDLPPPRPEKVPSRPKIQITVSPDEDYDNMYYGKWDCRGDSENELSFRHGDMIHIISREFDNKDWWVGRLDEKYGLVPKNFLIQAYKAV